MKTETFKLLGIGNEITFEIMQGYIYIHTVGVCASIETEKTTISVNNDKGILNVSFTSHGNSNSISFFLGLSETEKVKKFFALNKEVIINDK